MAQEHLQAVIAATGLPEDQVKALVELPKDAADFKPETYVTPIRDNVATQLKNDPEFYKTIDKKNIPETFYKELQAEQYGRSASEVRSALLKAVGMTEKDFADLGDEGKKIHVFAPAFLKKLTDGKIGPEELQKQLMEANTKIQSFDTEKLEIEKKANEKAEARIAENAFDFNVLAHVAKTEGLTTPIDYVAPNIAAKLKNQYAFVVNGNTVELRQKADPRLKVMIDNGTKELTLDKAVQDILVKDNLIDKKRTKTESGSTTIKVGAEEGELKISSHVDGKLQKILEADQKAGGA